MNNCKVIAFDFDGTLYSGVNGIYWQNFCEEWFKNYFKDLPEDEYLQLYDEFCKQNKQDEALIKILLRKNIDVNVWLNYRDTHICHKDFENATVISNLVLKELARDYILYIVSNSTINNIERQAGIMNIDLSYFKKIVVNKYLDGNTNKDGMLLQVIKEEDIKPSQLLMVGDSMVYDIEPALKIGAKVFKVADSSFTAEDIRRTL